MQFYIKRGDKIGGPYTDAQIKSGVKSGQLTQTDFISRSEDGPWKSLNEVVARQQPTTAEPQDAQTEILEPTASTDAPSVAAEPQRSAGRTEHFEPALADQDSASSQPASTTGATKDCPFCAEPIAAAAIKCKHCGSKVVPSRLGTLFSPATRKWWAVSTFVVSGGFFLWGILDMAESNSARRRWTQSSEQLNEARSEVRSASYAEDQLGPKYKVTRLELVSDRFLTNYVAAKESSSKFFWATGALLLLGAALITSLTHFGEAYGSIATRSVAVIVGLVGLSQSFIGSDGFLAGYSLIGFLVPGPVLLVLATMSAIVRHK